MKLSQKNRIIKKLNRDGFITRNECLRNFISRLGATIVILKHEGWEFDPKYMPDGDYRYTVIKYPYKKESLYVPEINKIIERKVYETK